MEDLVNKLVAAPAVQDRVESLVLSEIRVEGVNSFLSFPLQKWDLKKLFAVYTKEAACIPAAKISFESRLITTRDLSTIRKKITHVLQPEGAFQLKLSHLAIDTVGSRSCLLRDARPHGAFATLLLFLPSDNHGGDLCVTWDGQSTTCRSQYHSFMAFYNSCEVEVPPITNGSRSVVVYDVIYDNPSAHTRDVPPSLAPLLPLLRAAADVPRQPDSVLAFNLVQQYKALDFTALETPDAQFVAGLVAADCFDVALVHTAKPKAGVGRRDSDDDDEDGGGGRDVTANSRAEFLAMAAAHGVDGLEDDDSSGSNDESDERDESDGVSEGENGASDDGGDDGSEDDDADDTDDDGNESENDSANSANDMFVDHPFMILREEDDIFAGDFDSDFDEFSGDDDEADATEPDPFAGVTGYERVAPEQVSACAFHTSRAPPPVIQAVLLHKPLRAFVNNHPPYMRELSDRPLTYVVFWPRRHRVRLLGFRAAHAHLAALIAGESTELLGYVSVRALAVAVLDLFGTDVAALHDNRDLPDAVSLAPTLLALGDGEILASLVDALDFADFSAAGTQGTVHALVARVGWERLALPLERLLRDRTRHLDDVAHAAALVASLLPLAQPFALEFIKRLFHALLERVAALSEECCFEDVEPGLLQNLLRIERHLDAAPADGYFTARLPPGVARHIDAFVSPARVLALVRAQPITFHAINVLPATVLALRDEMPPALLQPLVEQAMAPTAAADEASGEGYGALLAVGLGIDSFDTTLRRVAALEPWLAIGALQALVTRAGPELSAGVNAAVLDLVLRMVERFLAAATGTSADDLANEMNTVVKAFDAVHGLGHPSRLADVVAGVVRRWHATPAAHHEAFALEYVLPWVTNALPDACDALRPIVALALPVLTARLATQKRPAQPQWALAPLPLPCACAKCAAIAAFVADPMRGSLTLPDADMCMHFHGVVERREPFELVELRYPLDGGIVLFKPAARRIREYDELADGVARIGDILGIDNAAVPPPAKRRRHGTHAM
ncbi:hypothetical protein ACHHYP_08941 [Achlya hypogyna]|uniref:Uncharacterized protein n=1 Tax=Achlya hypogyna TaxID=1202772 RepID=A0A1V9ZJX3_ACHHY|nr:hypothetical protein ACHHYP_08941 [Achlya hypogyna]